MIERKHKFKRMRGWAYTIMARCEYCNLEREGTKGNYTYLIKRITNPVNGNTLATKHSDIEPPCTPNKTINFKEQNKNERR